jgi:hypothetical protein
MKNDTHPSPTHLNFKSTLGPTDPMVDLKLDCMEMGRRWLGDRCLTCPIYMWICVSLKILLMYYCDGFFLVCISTNSFKDCVVKLTPSCSCWFEIQAQHCSECRKVI